MESSKKMVSKAPPPAGLILQSITTTDEAINNTNINMNFVDTVIEMIKVGFLLKLEEILSDFVKIVIWISRST